MITVKHGIRSKRNIEYNQREIFYKNKITEKYWIKSTCIKKDNREILNKFTEKYICM